MMLSVDLFFSFRSPYSYLALTRTRKMVADYDVTVNLRPVYPLAVRVPGFFKRTNPQFAKYVVLDSMPASPNTKTSRSVFPGPTRSCRTWRRSMSPSTSRTSIA